MVEGRGRSGGLHPGLSPALVPEIALGMLGLALLFVPRWPVGWASVYSVPAGAQVSTPEGVTLAAPVTIPVPEEGIELRLEMEGYAPSSTLACPGDSLVVYLEYLFPVTVSTVPSGASISIDGDPAGYSPVRTLVRGAGMHVVTAESGESISISDTLMLAGNKATSVSFGFPELVRSGLVSIPGGSIVLGGPDGPPVRSRIDLEPYYIGAMEVTNDEFCTFLAAADPFPQPDTMRREGMSAALSRMFPGNYPMEILSTPEGYAPRRGMGLHPVRGVSWSAACEYCEWLTGASGDSLVYRLPSEAEWQYAALAGGGGPWPWGDDEPGGLLLNCSDADEPIATRNPEIRDGYAETAPVGSFQPNPWGLSDMAGNVWEWCSDWAGGPGAATFEGGGPIRCLRGGSWLSSADDCRCEARLGLDSGLGYPFAGFRIAASR